LFSGVVRSRALRCRAEMASMAVMPVFTVTCALLVLAGVLKIRSPGQATSSLTLVGLRVPPATMRLLGVAEVAIGGVAAARPSAISAGAVAVAYGIFAVFIVRLRRRGEDVDCGCFGAEGSGATRIHIGLNAAACGAAVAAALAPPPGAVWILTRTPVVVTALVCGMAAAVLAAYAAFTLLPDAWRAYGSGERP
jgi:hypothetical protein